MNIDDQEIFSRLINAFSLCSNTDNQKRNFAEFELKQLSLATNYPLILMKFLSSQNQSFDGLLIASIELKKWSVKYKVRTLN